MKTVPATKEHQIMTDSSLKKSKFIPLNEIQKHLDLGWRYGRIDDVQKLSK